MGHCLTESCESFVRRNVTKISPLWTDTRRDCLWRTTTTMTTITTTTTAPTMKNLTESLLRTMDHHELVQFLTVKDPSLLLLKSNALSIESDALSAMDEGRSLQGGSSPFLAVDQLGLAGWWSACLWEAPNDVSCGGEYLPTRVVPFDVTGATCYINPNVLDYPAVHFFGKYGDLQGSNFADEIFLYTLLLDKDEFALLHPKDCDFMGVCSCSSIASTTNDTSVRPRPVDFESDAGWCTSAGRSKCRIRATFPLAEDRTCNVNAKYEHYDTSVNATRRLCVLQARLALLDKPMTKSPSAAPVSVLGGANTGSQGSSLTSQQGNGAASGAASLMQLCLGGQFRTIKAAVATLVWVATTCLLSIR